MCCVTVAMFPNFCLPWLSAQLGKRNNFFYFILNNRFMPIWFNKSLSLSDLVPLGPNTMAEYLGMEWVAVGDDYIKMKMPVDHRTKQPYGLLHGGASCALAETVGSIASHFVIDPARFLCVGLD